MSAINTFRTSRQFQWHCRMQLYENRIAQNPDALDSFLNRCALEHWLMCVYTITRMLLQSHNISTHIFLQRFVPSTSIGIRIVSCTTSITSTTAHKSICRVRIVVKKMCCYHTTFSRNSIFYDDCTGQVALKCISSPLSHTPHSRNHW